MNCSHKHAVSHVVARSPPLLDIGTGSTLSSCYSHSFYLCSNSLSPPRSPMFSRCTLSSFSSRILLDCPHITLQLWRSYIVAGPVPLSSQKCGRVSGCRHSGNQTILQQNSTAWNLISTPVAIIRSKLFPLASMHSAADIKMSSSSTPISHHRSHTILRNS
jgi:hypothetical protein